MVGSTAPSYGWTKVMMASVHACATSCSTLPPMWPSTPLADMFAEKLQGALQRQVRAGWMKIRAIVAVKSVTRRIDLNVDRGSLGRAQLRNVFKGSDRVALAEVHQNRAARPLAGIRRDLRRVVADGCR